LTNHASEDPLARARLLADDGRAAERRGVPEQALVYYDRALDLLNDLDEVGTLAEVLRWKGTVHRGRGETDEAYALFQRSSRVADTLAHPAAKAHALNCLASVAQHRGELPEAERLYDEATLMAIAAGERRLLGMIQQNLGVVANVRGDLDGALVRYRMSLRSFEAAGDDEAVSWVLNNLGMLHTDHGRFAEAEAAFERGRRIAGRRGDVRVAAALELSRVEMLVAAGRWDEAEDGCRHSVDAAACGDRRRRGEALKFVGIIERRRHRYDRAAAALAEGIRLASAADDALLSAELLDEIGETCRLRGATAEARLAWEEALAAFSRIGAAWEAGAVRRRLGALPS